MLNNSGNSTHHCRSLCSTSNISEQTPSSGRTRALTSLWNCWMRAIICGGTSMRGSTFDRRERSAVSYARSMKHIKRDTPALRPISCISRTTNIMFGVERSGLNLHCSSVPPLRLTVSAKSRNYLGLFIFPTVFAFYFVFGLSFFIFCLSLLCTFLATMYGRTYSKSMD